MKVFATAHAREMLDAYASMSVSSTHPLFERDKTAELEKYIERSRQLGETRTRVESYIAALEVGARCAFDAHVAEIRSTREMRASPWYSFSPDLDRSVVRSMRETARRAREIAQAFKAEGIAA